MTIDLTQIILAVITLLFGLVVRYVIPSIKAKTNADQMELIRAAVKSAVYAVEQLYKSKPGQEKKQMVLEMLRNQGFDLDDVEVEQTISTLVEEFVKLLNIEQREHLNE
ncbi:MAG: hypothetical protein IKS10_07350 [Lachnospiraceae bacterium]|nr:hypothetical protein [Lachnospiraceae bacterium]